MAHTKNLQAIITKTLDLLIHSALIYDIKTALNAGQKQKNDQLPWLFTQMPHTAPGNLWPSTEINLPAAAQSERGHQKRALFEWPHPTHWRGQQQEVDVTIDRLRVISVQPQARKHLSVNVRSTPLFCCHHFHQRAKVSVWKQSLFLHRVFVYCTGVVVLVSHSRCWKDLGEGFEKKHTECYSNQGSHKPLDPFGILVCTLWHRQAHIIYTLGYITQTNSSAHTTAKKATHAQDRLWSHNRALLF